MNIDPEQQSNYNEELSYAKDFVSKSSWHIFLTGKAGTGKTTFLHTLSSITTKKAIVVAPTGIAAINAGGQTIHSFFQIPFGPLLTKSAGALKSSLTEQKIRKNKIKLFRAMELLVIDEISMVRADVLDAIDEILRKYRRNSKPFGGVQLLLIGDIQQLPPVITNEDWSILKNFYPSLFFFNSFAFRGCRYIRIELKKIYRQDDPVFIQILNEVRDGYISSNTKVLLNQRYVPDFDPDKSEHYIRLSTHNASVKAINDKKISLLKGKLFTYKADIEGDFPKQNYPTDGELELKIGAQVMFIRNDSSTQKRFYNGKIGEVTFLNNKKIHVKCEDLEEVIVVPKEQWEEVKYELDKKSGSLKTKIVGVFTQFPLKLAWAITIHKSQGLTFSKAIIDTNRAFDHGQTYVALSRCRSLEGLVLTQPFNEYSVICNETVRLFHRISSDVEPNPELLDKAHKEFQVSLLNDIFGVESLKLLVFSATNLLQKQTRWEGSLYDVLEEILMEIIEPMNEISERFVKQISALIYGNKRKELSQRLQDGANYYLDKLCTAFVKKLTNAIFESDNTELRVEWTDLNESFFRVIQAKTKCFQALQNATPVDNLKPLISKLEGRLLVKPQKFELKGVVSTNPSLFARIKLWREEQADNESRPVSSILHFNIMKTIADYAPVTMSQLKAIQGVGDSVVTQYGRAILEQVREWKVNPEKKEDPLKKLNKSTGLNLTEQLFEIFRKEKES
ncbi:AAA family ATPase [Halosquirtibacter laminarini]|uniref:AAA family ATPase n=1 Tax=Halosquirtibacter laminarini TaxID=3374600 RepID=A0AC61NFP0_9BACT|nr:AAA family ATPase [Prolixibacteraceae bacterium]